jgi:hypothetical protein
VQQYRVGREARIGEARRRKHTDGNLIPSLIVAIAMRLDVTYAALP